MREGEHGVSGSWDSPGSNLREMTQKEIGFRDGKKARKGLIELASVCF